MFRRSGLSGVEERNGKKRKRDFSSSEKKKKRYRTCEWWEKCGSKCVCVRVCVICERDCVSNLCGGDREPVGGGTCPDFSTEDSDSLKCSHQQRREALNRRPRR